MSGHRDTMKKSSIGRRSSVLPVRMLLDIEEKSQGRTDMKKGTTSKPRPGTSTEASHIPRPRVRSLSSDRASGRKSTIVKATGKTPMQYTTATPRTPSHQTSDKHLIAVPGSSGMRRFPSGPRSPTGDRISNLGAKGPRKDTRPLNDKSYQAIMLNKIDSYFQVNQYSSMLNSNGSLKPITLKMFVEVSAFLVKLLGIKQNLTINNYVEELPKIAKNLLYPGIMNKSWLKTANAMHSWPNVLAWLSWLVEVCEVKALAVEKYTLENLPFIGINEEQAEMNRLTLSFMFNSYNAWNEENEEEEEALAQKYLQKIEEKQGISEEMLIKDKSEVETEMEKLRGIEEMSKEITGKVEYLKEVLTSLQNDEALLLNKTKLIEEHIKNLTETDQINAECDVLREQIHAHKEKEKKLTAISKEQSMMKVEKNQLLTKCMDEQSYIDQLDEYFNKMQKELYSIDMKLSSLNNNLNKAIITYNGEFGALCNEDITVEDLKIEDLKMPERNLSDPEITDVIKAKVDLMNNFIEKLTKMLTEKEFLVESDTKNLELLDDRVRVLQEEYENTEEKLKEEICAYADKIETDMKKEEERQKQLQSDIKKLQESRPNLELAKKELEEAREKRDALLRRKEFVQQKAEEFFEQFYAILGEGRSETVRILQTHLENQRKLPES